MLLTSVALARWMGAEGYGVYATAIALVLLLTVPTGLGLPTLMIRFLASYQVHQQWGLMRGLLVRGNQVVLGASLLTAAIASIAIWGFAGRFGIDSAATYSLALVLIPLTALGALRSAALRGLHHVILGQLPENLIMPGLFLALVVGWWLAQGYSATLSPEWAIVARIAATGVAFGIGAALFLRRIPEPVRKAAPKYELGVWGRSALPLLFIAGMNVINTQTDILMLAALRGSESAGVYQAAARGAELVAFSLVIVNMAIQPTISRLHTDGDIQRLQRVVTMAARVTLALALPVALVLIFLARPILGWVFGGEFERGALCLAILCGAQLVNVVAGPVALILNMTGYERDSAIGMMVGVLTNLTLNALLIPRWDIEGAAFATGLSLALWNLVLIGILRRRIGVSTTVIGHSRMLR